MPFEVLLHYAVYNLYDVQFSSLEEKDISGFFMYYISRHHQHLSDCFVWSTSYNSIYLPGKRILQNVINFFPVVLLSAPKPQVSSVLGEKDGFSRSLQFTTQQVV